MDAAARAQVMDAIAEFQHRLDAGLDVADLFEPDAVFHRPPARVEGAGAIARFFGERRTAGTVRHQSSNFRFEAATDGAIVARYLVTVLRGHDARLEAASVGDATDEWRRDGEGRWRLRATRFATILQRDEKA